MTLMSDRMLQASDVGEATAPVAPEGASVADVVAVDLSTPSNGTEAASGVVVDRATTDAVSPLSWLSGAGATRPIGDAIGVAAVAVAIAAPSARILPLVLAGVAVVLPLLGPASLRELIRLRGAPGTQTVGRTSLVLLGLVLTTTRTWPLWVAAALVASAVLVEPFMSRLARTAIPYAANVPGIRVRSRGPIAEERVFVVNLAASIAVPVLIAAGAGAGWLLIPALAAAVATTTTAVDAALRIHARRAAEFELGAALAEYGPRFALHWDAPPGTEYQVTMWLPYLERIGVPFMVVIRNPRTFAEISALTDAPVVVRRDPRDLDLVVAPSLTTVFYVNNAARNTHFVRFPGLAHVQLNHGESDKAPSYSPVFRMYDSDFVAGQAAIDRFARNGVDVSPQLFTVVGRPQVEDVGVRSTSSAAPTALYAPTWGGANTDSDYCSLPIGVAIVGTLLARGYTVVYRPHPYTRRNREHARQSDRITAMLAADAKESGRAHRYGAQASRAMSLTDCFNAADLLVSDVSSVVPDFLYSEKPFAITAMQGEPADEFVRDFPVAEAGYVIDQLATNLDDVFDTITGPDPLAARREQLKSYFLGDFDPEHYADAFLGAAREVVGRRTPVRMSA